MDHLIADLLLGLIEGITEFLPISSTGHLLIAERWLGARSDLFNIAIQAGAILAVVLIYRQRLLQLLQGLGKPANRDYVLKLGTAFGVSAVLGLVAKKLGFALPETITPVAWALVIGGFVMLGAEALAARRGGENTGISWTVAVLVGVAQVVAGIFPGTSRSAAAIFAALLFGTGSRVAATEFAFLVGIPTMFAATGYELLHVLRDGGAGSEDWAGLGVAFVTSAITAFVVVKWLLAYIQTHRFTVFSWYRIALGAVLLTLPGLQADSAIAQAAGTSPAPASAELAESRAGMPVPATSPNVAMSGDAAMLADKARADALAALRREADRRYAALKLCVDGVRMREAMRHPEVQADLEAVARGDNTLSDDPAWNKKVMDRLATSLESADRSSRECEGLEAQMVDGSLYDVALEAAKLGNQRAAACYVAGAFPMSEARWKDRDFHERYRVEAARLIERGIAAGDWAMVRLASVASAPNRPKKPGTMDQPWRDPGFNLTFEIDPSGNPARLYALFRLRQLGENQGKGDNLDRQAAFWRKGLNPRQVAGGDAWAQRTFAASFGNRRRTPDPFDLLCD